MLVQNVDCAFHNWWRGGTTATRAKAITGRALPKRNATGVAAECAVCAATAPTTTGDMPKAAPMPGKEPQSSTSLANADHPGRLERLEAALAQQQETIARLQQENAELSLLRLQEGSAEQVNEDPTAALSIADGLDAELDINMYLDSEGEEMTKSPSQ
ncbi:hypothetical protein N7530_004537 [Penicillium desertorum]|uniref:Uncharacterized protein n=1 Tax=Penicillium desertorum TaxID=1303715 RepID=A0A9W9WYE1_9EURO|nr:hypothetical protein N7530_004537 [Penicillium desertorum]